MNKLRIFALLSLPTMMLGAAGIAACGDDTVVTANDAGNDATTDSATPDTGTDTGIVDAGPRPDVVTPNNVAEFASEVERELCSALTRCCFGNAALQDGGVVDGGRYNAAECGKLYKDIGFEFSSTGFQVVDGGEATVDKAKATDCLGQIQLLSCSLTGADMAKTRSTCFDALVGTRKTGEACEAAIECARGNYCDLTTNKCAPLKGDGGACSIYNSGNAEVDSVRSEEACSWRGSGDTQLRCDSYDENSAGDPYRPRDQWLCRPQVDSGVGCNSTVWCKDSICDAFNGFVCTAPVEIFTNYCPRVVTP